MPTSPPAPSSVSLPHLHPAGHSFRTRAQAGKGWLLALLLQVGGFAGLLPFEAREASAAPLTVSLGTLAPEGTSYHRSLLEMREKWRKAPAGGVNLRVYGGGKMGGEAKMVSQMRLGSLDAALLTSTGLAEIEPGVAGQQSIPMMFRTLDEVDYIAQKLHPTLEARMEKAGFVVLFWSDGGWTHFFSKQPMITPEDLKKVKLFIWAGDATYHGIWKSGGFQPVPLETADIVPMLDTGLITCVPMPPFAALATQIYTRAPHMLALKWAPLTGGMVIRKAVWDKIPAETRAELLRTAAETGKLNKAQSRAESLRAIDAMKEKGVIVHEVSPELDAQWRKVAETFYPQVKGGLVPADIFNEVDKALKDYRESHGSAKP